MSIIILVFQSLQRPFQNKFRLVPTTYNIFPLFFMGFFIDFVELGLKWHVFATAKQVTL